MKNKQKSLTKKDRPALLAVTAGSAIGFPECGSEAWKNQEVERMLDNDRYDREQASKKRVEWWIENAEGLAKERTLLRETLVALNHRVHSGYDFNADPDGMTLRVSEAVRLTSPQP